MDLKKRENPDRTLPQWTFETFANGGEHGLAAIRGHGPYSMGISEMRCRE